MLSMSVAPVGLAAQRSAQLAACRSRRHALSDALADIQRRQRNIGLSALVMLDGETVLAEDLGYADLENRVPVTNETAGDSIAIMQMPGHRRAARPGGYPAARPARAALNPGGAGSGWRTPAMAATAGPIAEVCSSWP